MAMPLRYAKKAATPSVLGVVSEAPHGSRQLEQFLEDVEFEILAMLKRGNEDYAPSPRSKAVNDLLANLQGQDQVVVPTDKTNSFRLVDSKDYIRWVKAHLNASAKVVSRQHLMDVLSVWPGSPGRNGRFDGGEGS
jgi:hypothetical protein